MKRTQTGKIGAGAHASADTGGAGARPAPRNRSATAPKKRATAAPPPPVKREVDHSLADRLLPLSAVMELAGLGKTIIYKKMKAGTFPKCCKPGGASSRWSEREVMEWRDKVLADRVNQ